MDSDAVRVLGVTRRGLLPLRLDTPNQVLRGVRIVARVHDRVEGALVRLDEVADAPLAQQSVRIRRAPLTGVSRGMSQ